MEAAKLTITSSALAHGRFNIRACGKAFFPSDAFGKPSRDAGIGHEIILHVTGLDDPVLTDLPTERSGQPRWFFRHRAWVKKFCSAHKLSAGDKVIITRFADYEYRISPVFKDIRFIDLFAGIGGTHIGFEAAGARCVFSSEWDKHAQKTYETNFGDKPAGDIRLIDAKEIPDHEILLAVACHS